MDQNRFKSPVVWTAVAAQIVTILILIGVIDAGQGDTINAVIASVCQLLVVFGFLIIPKIRRDFNAIL